MPGVVRRDIVYRHDSQVETLSAGTVVPLTKHGLRLRVEQMQQQALLGR